jgi:hypothetical protein
MTGTGLRRETVHQIDKEKYQMTATRAGQGWHTQILWISKMRKNFCKKENKLQPKSDNENQGE